MSNAIETYVRACGTPRCGHDRASHYAAPPSVTKDAYGVEKRTEACIATCLVGGCDCKAFTEPKS